MTNKPLPPPYRFPIKAVIHPNNLMRVVKLKTSLDFIPFEIHYNAQAKCYAIKWEHYIRPIKQADVSFLLCCSTYITYADTEADN